MNAGHYSGDVLHVLRRIVPLALASLSLSIAVPAAAGAQQQDVGWWLAGYSATHWTVDWTDGTHFVADRCQTSCSDTTPVVDWWLPSYCLISSVSEGDGAGNPLTVRLQSSNPYRACLPSGSAWSDGWAVEGSSWVHPWYGRIDEQWVFPRDQTWPWSRGSVVRIW